MAPRQAAQAWGQAVSLRGLPPSAATLSGLLDAHTGLLRQPSAPSAALDAEDRLRLARARWRGGRDEAALALLATGAGDAAASDPLTAAETAVLSALITPPGSAAGRAAVQKALATPGLPARLRVLAAGAAALSPAEPGPGAPDAAGAPGKLHEALAQVEALATPLGGDPELELLRHRLLVQVGRGNDATRVLELQARRRALDPLAHLELARYLVATPSRAGGAAPAARAVERYLALKPGSTLGHTLAGQLALQAGDLEAARRALRQVEAIGPATAGTWLATRLALRAGDVDGARDRARRALASPEVGPRIDGLEALALADRAAGQPVAAVEAFRTAAQAAADHAPARAAHLLAAAAALALDRADATLTSTLLLRAEELARLSDATLLRTLAATRAAWQEGHTTAALRLLQELQLP
jgi:hypothetical protein